MPHLILLVVANAADEIGEALIEEAIDIRAHFPQRHRPTPQLTRVLQANP
jgi:hypothetical protein